MAVLLVSDQTLADMYGIGNVKGSRLPLVLVPTTAGTGSEVTNISIITTEKPPRWGSFLRSFTLISFFWMLN